jgi:hypothetical protein
VTTNTHIAWPVSVNAARILEVTDITDRSEGRGQTCPDLLLRLEDGRNYTANSSMTSWHVPTPGDYVVKEGDEEYLEAKSVFERKFVPIGEVDVARLSQLDQIRQLEAEVARLTKLAKQNDADANMYARAWQRELAGFLRPKRHHIDMVVVSTQDLVKRCRQAEKRLKDLSRDDFATCPGKAPPAAVVVEPEQVTEEVCGSPSPPLDEPGYRLSQCEGSALPHLGQIIDWLEAAEGGDRALDELIAREVRCIAAPTPAYTSSVDAALTLVHRGAPYELNVYGSGDDGATFTCAGYRWWPRPEDKAGWRAEAGNKLSPALALCIAALKVRQAWAEESTGFQRSAAEA